MPDLLRTCIHYFHLQKFQLVSQDDVAKLNNYPTPNTLSGCLTSIRQPENYFSIANSMRQVIHLRQRFDYMNIVRIGFV